MSKRGFHVKSPEGKELLETVGRSFLTGYAYAAEARHPLDAEAGLEEIPRQFRGFAYEGAAMALAMRDGLSPRNHSRVDEFLTGRAANHVYMVYVGVGWAMARLPKARWARIDVADPLLRWLVLDGYGFHQAYFRTAQYVHGQREDADFPWPLQGSRDYSHHAIDQGIGRAMWFVGGTDPEYVANMFDEFPERRRADLWAGAGLAATYAGGVSEDDLRYFLKRGQNYSAQIGQASVFAAAAREEAGLTIPHTELATRVLCGMTPAEATRLSREVRPLPPVDGEVPAYEVWRTRISDAVVARAEA